MSRDIELRIDELVLDGLEVGDGRIVGEAVRRELTRLLAERGVPASWAADGLEARVRQQAGGDAIRSASSPEEMGRQIARSIYGSSRGGPQQ